MRPASAKAKGRKLQNELRDRLLTAFPELHPSDVKCAIMGERGEDVHLSLAAQLRFPFSVECKNVERLNIHAALEQATKNADGRTPLVVFRKNRTITYAALPLDTLLEILR
jgi:hypothetical protein